MPASVDAMRGTRIENRRGVSFAVLGPAETCTGDPARRMGNEFVYSMLAQQNVETLNETGLGQPGKKIVASWSVRTRSDIGTIRRLPHLAIESPARTPAPPAQEPRANETGRLVP